MANREVQEYIKKQLKAGSSKESIKKSLLGAGWKKEDVDKAFHLLNRNPSKTTLDDGPGSKKNIITISVLSVLVLIFLSGLFILISGANDEPINQGEIKEEIDDEEDLEAEEEYSEDGLEYPEEGGNEDEDVDTTDTGEERSKDETGSDDAEIEEDEKEAKESNLSEKKDKEDELKAEEEKIVDNLAHYCTQEDNKGAQHDVGGDRIYCDGQGGAWSPTINTDNFTPEKGGVDSDTFLRWAGIDCYQKVAGATSKDDGAFNTDKALALNCLEENRAITICDDLEWAGSDSGKWYLPALNELKFLYEEEGSKPSYDYNAKSTAYWTSTEFFEDSVYLWRFDDGRLDKYTKFTYFPRVRCAHRQ